MYDQTYDFSEVETALCIYEHLCDVNTAVETNPDPDRPAWHDEIHAGFAGDGVYHMKGVAIGWCKDADIAWNLLGDDNDLITHDWEFIPLFVQCQYESPGISPEAVAAFVRESDLFRRILARRAGA